MSINATSTQHIELEYVSPDDNNTINAFIDYVLDNVDKPSEGVIQQYQLLNFYGTCDDSKFDTFARICDILRVNRNINKTTCWTCCAYGRLGTYKFINAHSQRVIGQINIEGCVVELRSNLPTYGGFIRFEK